MAPHFFGIQLSNFYIWAFVKFYILLLIILSIGQGCTSPDRVPDSANFVLTKTLSETKELAEAEFKVVESEITLTGKVTFDENKVARVFPLVGGFVKELNAEIGDYVRKGQVLAIVRSQIGRAHV